MSLVTADGIDLDALNYTIKVPYNGTGMTGGDSLTSDLNIFYDVSSSDLISRHSWKRAEADLVTTLGR